MDQQRQQQRQQQQQQLVEAQRKQNELASILVNAGVKAVKANPKTTSLWLLGMALMLFASGFSVSEEQQRAYDKIVSNIDDERSYRAEDDVLVARRRYYDSKGLFWSCDARCQRNYEALQAAEHRYARIQAEDAKTMSEAKKVVGLMSTHGVQETRDLFWSTFAKGRGFAKRASMWDMLFMGIGSMGRDENILSFFIRWLVQLAMNFTMGMFGALVAFYWYLWDIVSSYQANSMLSIVFAFLAVVAATSFVASFLIAMYCAAAGTVYVAVKAAGPNALRIGDQQRQRQAYLRHRGYNGRQGYGGGGFQRRPHQF